MGNLNTYYSLWISDEGTEAAAPSTVLVGGRRGKISVQGRAGYCLTWAVIFIGKKTRSDKREQLGVYRVIVSHQ